MTLSPQVSREIVAYYETVFDESDRLTATADGQLELVRTQELLRRHLPPPPASVIDIGGGPGTHAQWLIQDGYQVHVVDPVPRHVEQAAITGATAELGDARELSAATGTYDVALVLGPMYHLVEREDRLRSLAEARRVTRPDGLVAVAAINRYAALFEQTATTLLERTRMAESVADILRTGQLLATGRERFTTSYFHAVAELQEELCATGFSDVAVYGVEGPAWSMLKATEQHSGEPQIDTPLFRAALAAARIADDHPELLAAGSHLLALATHPS
ncbi:MAG: class I SAM-dependent methyltransferase [Micromonosporaceae bacterium]